MWVGGVEDRCVGGGEQVCGWVEVENRGGGQGVWVAQDTCVGEIELRWEVKNSE